MFSGSTWMESTMGSLWDIPGIPPALSVVMISPDGIRACSQVPSGLAPPGLVLALSVGRISPDGIRAGSRVPPGLAPPGLVLAL